MLNLSPRGDLVEAAANLFSDLRTLDRPDVATIAVMPVPHEGLGEAINDRLARAAAPKVRLQIAMNCNEQARHRRSSPATLARLIAIVGEKIRHHRPGQAGALSGRVARRSDRGHTPVVLRPGSTEEVSAILKLANETSTAIVPQGGNTGLVGGQIPHNGEVVLSLNRLDKIREVDAVSNTITVEAGVTLQRAREAAANADRLYPQLLPSEGTCTIGGNLSTNAGGTAALAHGIARSHALGLEVVLADGRVLQQPQQAEEGQHRLRPARTCSSARKARSASSPRRCCGWCRGRARSRPPVPACRRRRPRSICSGIATERTAGGVTSFEIMARAGIDIVLKHDAGARDPLAEPSSLVCADRTVVAAARGPARGDGGDPRRRASRRAWCSTPPSPRASNRPRRSGASAKCSARCSATIGGSIKHDVSVPVAAIPAFIEEANAAATKLIPGCRPMPFGHVGDGNIHYNVTQPVGADKAEFLARWDDVNDVVYEVVQKYGGSISAEHGVGVDEARHPAEDTRTRWRSS